MGEASADLDVAVSRLSPLGSGRDVVTCLAVSCAHSHLFIALADGHCMRWTFSPSCDAGGTVIVDSTSDITFTKSSDVRMGHIHSMHVTPYGSSLTVTRSALPPTHTPSLRMPRSICIHRCSIDVVLVPMTIVAHTAFCIIPWNGAAALELCAPPTIISTPILCFKCNHACRHGTCSRTHSYWRDSLLSMWSLVCQKSLSLEHAFKGLQAYLLSIARTRTHTSPFNFQIMFVLLTGCPPALFPFDGALMCIRRQVHCCFFPPSLPCVVSLPMLLMFTSHAATRLHVTCCSSTIRSLLYLRALAGAGAASAISQVCCVCGSFCVCCHVTNLNPTVGVTVACCTTKT